MDIKKSFQNYLTFNNEKKRVGNHGISEEVNNLPVYSQKVRRFVGHHAYPCRPETKR